MTENVFAVRIPLAIFPNDLWHYWPLPATVATHCGNIRLIL